ncbi:hypothetical protein DERF_009559 [Dermatophagoides farinae]|uniref:Uncharacterized protein n=1 Tax=Dermatophagoides farinae TaxID=6954 RepID=A0A922L5V6_DERFA|nr:hypothetical protein DERF_009559 [Dermatophagoides farinae]
MVFNFRINSKEKRPKHFEPEIYDHQLYLVYLVCNLTGVQPSVFRIHDEKEIGYHLDHQNKSKRPDYLDESISYLVTE